MAQSTALVAKSQAMNGGRILKVVALGIKHGKWSLSQPRATVLMTLSMRWSSCSRSKWTPPPPHSRRTN